MKKLTQSEKSKAAKTLVHEIKELHQDGEVLRFMEVCGTHTVSIFREGIRQLVPEGIELLSGPGCPVCVTNQDYVDTALAYAERDDIMIATFGDMLKVPGSTSTLGAAKAKGASIEVVYSPMDIIPLSAAHKDKKIVFLAIGFETTIAIIAATVKLVYDQGLSNIFFLVSHKLVPPALKALIESEESAIDGFILPGHVSVIIGEEPYAFLRDTYKMPAAIAGFDGLEILEAIASLVRQHRTGNIEVDNVYKSVVAKKGNPIAQQLMAQLYEVVDEPWRGIGTIPQSGLALRPPYDRLDIEKVVPLERKATVEVTNGCQCGQVLQGHIQPSACPLFGRACTPDHPVGACMVSVEGSCAAWYKYGFFSGGFVWKET